MNGPALSPRRVWYVLHVKPRTEKKVDALLAQSRFFHFLPVRVKVTKVQRRKVRRELPLFPGYVFTRLNAGERRTVLETNLVVHALPVPDPRTLVHQLRQISRAARHAPELAETNPFKTGDRVRVKSGPLYGLDGYVKREGASAKIVLNLEILGRAVEVLVSPGDCAPL